MKSILERQDPRVYRAIRSETERQATTLELIASENFVSEAVLEAQGSVLTNKYAEGYPGKRYYGGCEHVDVAESLAIERAKKLFGAEHVNVQPHSGTQANLGVYFCALKPGDPVMGLSLAHGGHLSHGHPLNLSGLYFTVVPYSVRRDTELIDYDEVDRLALERRPKMIVVGASAYARTLDFVRFRTICDKVGALLFVDMAHIAGLVAAGIHPSPFPHADFVTTTTHKTLRGPRGGLIFCKAQYAPALDKMIFPGSQGGPLMHVIAAKAVALGEALKPSFKTYQRQIVKNARALAAELQDRGARIVSGGTDTHLFLVDVRPKGMTGKEAEEALGRAGITVNKNAIPYDPQKPFIASGIRVGTPAVTTRGMKEREMRTIGQLIDRALTGRSDPSVLGGIRAEVGKLCARFPLYASRLRVGAGLAPARRRREC